MTGTRVSSFSASVDPKLIVAVPSSTVLVARKAALESVVLPAISCTFADFGQSELVNNFGVKGSDNSSRKCSLSGKVCHG